MCLAHSIFLGYFGLCLIYCQYFSDILDIFSIFCTIDFQLPVSLRYPSISDIPHLFVPISECFIYFENLISSDVESIETYKLVLRLPR